MNEAAGGWHGARRDNILFGRNQTAIPQCRLSKEGVEVKDGESTYLADVWSFVHFVSPAKTLYYFVAPKPAFRQPVQ